jgi:hypothetical protein
MQFPLSAVKENTKITSKKIGFTYHLLFESIKKDITAFVIVQEYSYKLKEGKDMERMPFPGSLNARPT